jgi:hypothetical protein
MSYRIEQNLMLEQFYKGADDLSADERAFLCRLNEKLMELERQVKAEILRLLEVGAAREKETALCNQGCNVECEVLFMLRETDPAWDEEQDNILAKLLSCYHADKQWEFGIADGINHNEFEHRAGHPMKDEFHGWWYHELYHHTDLSWGDLPRIEFVFINLQLQFQSRMEF